MKLTWKQAGEIVWTESLEREFQAALAASRLRNKKFRARLGLFPDRVQAVRTIFNTVNVKPKE